MQQQQMEEPCLVDDEAETLLFGGWDRDDVDVDDNDNHCSCSCDSDPFDKKGIQVHLLWDMLESQTRMQQLVVQCHSALDMDDDDTSTVAPTVTDTEDMDYDDDDMNDDDDVVTVATDPGSCQHVVTFLSASHAVQTVPFPTFSA